MKESYFDGGLLQLIGYRLLGFFVTVLTLGICLPWAYTMVYNWETKHTVINGERLTFDGTAVGLFGNWIKWFLLTVITLGIYGLWVGIKLKKWRVSHTHTESNPYGESYFDGGLLQLAGWTLLGGLFSIITLGLGTPWACTKLYGWEINHTIINGQRMHFNGTALGLFGNWIKWFLLTLITIGIYGFWLEIKMEKWLVKHSNFT